MWLKAAEVLECLDCGDYFTEMAWGQQCWDEVRLLETWVGLSGVHAISQQLSAVEDQLPGVFRLKAMVLKCPSSAVAIVAFASVLCIYWSMPQHRDGRGLAKA